MKKLFDYDFSSTSVFVPPKFANDSSRNFPGAYKKKNKKNGPYGPANAPMVASHPVLGGFTGGYGTANDPVVFPSGEGGGDAGEGVRSDAMMNTDKFDTFLESLKNNENQRIIEIVKEGFDYIYKN